MADTFADLVEQLANETDTAKKNKIKNRLNKMYRTDVKAASSKSGKTKSRNFATDAGIPETMFDAAGEDGVSNLIKSLGGFKTVIDDYKQLVKLQAEFVQQGGQHFSKFAEGQDFQKAVSQTGEAMFKYFGNIQEGQAAYKATASSMKSFLMVNNKVKQDMAATVGIANKLGIETSTMTGIFDTAIQSFGLTGDQAVDLGKKVANMSQQLAMSPQELATNFAAAQKSLLYDSGKVEGIFRKLQFTSRATGVSFNDLTNAFGSSMDSFQGSSQKAGKLNAILGKSVFNSIDLLGKSESERLETIVGGIRKNLRGGVQNLGKFELISIADGLGMSPDETRRLLSGKTTVDAALKSKAPKDPREKALNKMAEGALNVDASFGSLVETLKATRDPFKQAFIDVSSRTRDSFKGLIEQLGAPLGANNVQDLIRGTSRTVSNIDLSDPSALDKLINQSQSLVKLIEERDFKRAAETFEEMQSGSTGRAAAPKGRKTDFGATLDKVRKQGDEMIKDVTKALKGWVLSSNVTVMMDGAAVASNSVSSDLTVNKKARLAAGEIV